MYKYMSTHRIGSRALRAGLHDYLSAVANGDTIEVVNDLRAKHQRVVARITPVAPDEEI